MAAATEERIIFAVAEDSCEGMLAYPAEGDPQYALLLLAPHPLLGGDMHNNVIRHLAMRAAESGAVTLRFNYRGVGNSTRREAAAEPPLAFFRRMEAQHDYRVLLPESEAALDFLLRSIASPLPLTVAGYSLGTIMAGLLAIRRPHFQIVGISPPNTRVSMECFNDCTASKVFVGGTADPFYQEAKFGEQLKRMPEPKALLSFPGADHFYRGEEEALFQRIRPFLVQGDEA